MKVLVCSASYPTEEGGRAMYYVHSRNLYYRKEDIEVVVINFSTNRSYYLDGIRVLSFSEYKKFPVKADLLICHAPNLRNHFVFLKKYGDLYPKKMLIFHGHEILHLNKYYPMPYAFVKENRLKQIMQFIYDTIKIFIWKRYIIKNESRLRMIFVSNWLRDQFYKEFKIDSHRLSNTYVISNSVGEFFSENNYEEEDIKYDFLTIRNYLDVSKYCIDIVYNLAINNPDYKFCVIGKGDFFKYYECPSNIVFINKELSHEDMRSYMNSSRFALLPTREDTQGLMACEFATYGMRLITSNIDVCQEVFSDCPNAILVSNDNIDLKSVICEFDKMDGKKDEKWNRFMPSNTIYKEIQCIKDFVSL